MNCCQSTPRCRNCPVRLARRARSHAPGEALASLLAEIYRPAPPAPPDPVVDVLLALSAAREDYRVNHARAGSASGLRTRRRWGHAQSG